MFPYIGGQIPQPNNPVNTAAQSFSMTQKAIADNLMLQQQKQYNKAYPQILQDQMNMAAAQLAEQQVKSQYAPQTAEANYAKLLADTEAAQINNQYAESTALANIAAIEALEAQRLAAAEKNKRSNQGGNLPAGLAGQVQYLTDLKSQGRTEEAALLETLLTQQNKGSRYGAFRTIPEREKSELLAEAAGLGYDKQEAALLFDEGHSLTDLAEMQGIPAEDMSLYPPIYPPTNPTLTRMQNRIAVEEEMKYITPIATEWVSEYIDPYNINGYSIEQIADAASGANPEKQEKFFAGISALKEVNYMRLRLAGGETGISSLLHLEDSVVGKRKAFERFMTPDIYLGSQELLNDLLIKGAEHANDVLINPKKYAKKPNQESEVDVPDFSKMTDEELDAWLEENK